MVDGAAHDGHWTVELDPVTLAPGIAGERRLVLSNGSTGPAVLQGIRTSCKCLTAIMEPTEVTPGSSATLALRLEPHKAGIANQIAWLTFADGSVLRIRVDLEVR